MRRSEFAADGRPKTIITWSDADRGMASIFSSHAPMMKFLKDHLHADLRQEFRNESGTLIGVEYAFPTKCLALLGRPRSQVGMQRGSAGARPTLGDHNRAAALLSAVENR